MKAYGGSILRINVSDGTTSKTPLEAKLARDFVGGRGFAAKLLFDEVPSSADPLGPHNKLVMASGPLSGLLVPAAGKITFAAKSPATGGWGDTNMGGHIAAELKYAGYDVVVLEGMSPKPVYILIDNEKVEVRDASHLWGMGAFDAESALKRELGEDFQIALIGPAGENLVKFACISHDFGRQAGRTGAGAVMGSKRVKAIAVRGDKAIDVADPKGMLQFGKEMYDACFASPALQEWQRYGTSGVTVWANSIGGFPTRNFQSGFFEHADSLSGENMRKAVVITDKACFGCPMACGKYSHVTKPGQECYVEGPEYETTALVGGNCALTDISDVAYANYILDDLGVDTISGGNAIAFAMECFERGLISKEEAGGTELRFGSIEAVVRLAQSIAAREGLGNILADGVRAASKSIGGGSERFAIQVKGLEWSGYESRYAPANMLAYCTADVGSHHNRAWAITHDIAVGRDQLEGKAQKVIDLQHIRPMFDNLGVCRLLWVEIAFGLEFYPKAMELATGERWTLDELVRSSERVWNLTRAFWRKHNPDFGRKYDMPPARFYEDPVPTGPTEGHFITRDQLDQLLGEYYQLRGWTTDGIPTKGKLKELGLENAVKTLYEQ